MIKALLIGLGNIGMQYDINKPQNIILTHARALKRIDGIELIGAVDKEYKTVRTFEKNFGIQTYKDTGKAMRETTPELVVIALPTHLHKEIIRKICEYRTTKYILCEKPMGLNYKEAEEITRMCEKQDIKLWVNYIRRVDKGTTKIKEIIDHEWSEKKIKGICWYTNGLRNNGLHFIDLCEYWLGEIRQIRKIGEERQINNHKDQDCYIEFEKGNIIFWYGWEEAFTHYSIELISPNGRIYYGQGGEKIEIQQLVESNRYSNEVNLGEPREIENSMMRYQINVYEQLLKEISEKEEILCSGRKAVRYHWHIENMSTNT